MQVSPKLGFNWIISTEGEETDVSAELESSRAGQNYSTGRNYVWCTWHLISIWRLASPLKVYLEYAICFNAYGLLDYYIKHDLSVPLGLWKAHCSFNVINGTAKLSHNPFIQVFLIIFKCYFSGSGVSQLFPGSEFCFLLPPTFLTQQHNFFFSIICLAFGLPASVPCTSLLLPFEILWWHHSAWSWGSQQEKFISKWVGMKAKKSTQVTGPAASYC